MTYRVIQWATGGVGRAAIEGVLGHPDLELAGCWVHSAEKDGVDVGTLIGREPIGVAASSDVDTVLALDADCVLYSPLMADPAVVTRILESGKNVVTPLGWFYPPAGEREGLDKVCRAAGVTLHGTGIHPGGITERFPLMLSALCGSITHVRAEEFSDIRTYGAAKAALDRMTRNMAPELAPRVRVNAIDVGGVATRSLDVVLTDETLRQMFLDGTPMHRAGEPEDIACAVLYLVSDAASWVTGKVFEVEVTGDPSVFVTFKKLHPESIEAGLARNPGIVATAMHCVNAIPYVCAAEPGLLTYLDMPLVAGRAAQR